LTPPNPWSTMTIIHRFVKEDQHEMSVDGSRLDCKNLKSRHWFDCFESIKGEW
jgi:hypothetical protein